MSHEVFVGLAFVFGAAIGFIFGMIYGAYCRAALTSTEGSGS